MGAATKHLVRPDRVKPSFCNFWHPGTLTLRAERQSARMSKILNDAMAQLLYSGTSIATVGVKRVSNTGHGWHACWEWESGDLWQVWREQVRGAVQLVAMVTDCEVAAAAVSTNNPSSLSACVRSQAAASSSLLFSPALTWRLDNNV